MESKPDSKDSGFYFYVLLIYLKIVKMMIRIFLQKSVKN